MAEGARDRAEPAASSDIARYYDRNTSGFLSFGGGGASLAIHRQLWGPGVDTAEDAARHINTLIAEAIAALPGNGPSCVLDLGCGVGGTLFDLAAHLPDSALHGITISEKQYELAKQLAAARPDAQRFEFRLGDFEQARLAVKADVLIAVESFAHSRSAAGFFRTAATHLKSGGRLILVDDFLLAGDGRLSAKTQALVNDFRRGWRVPGFGTVHECVAAAAESGLACVEERDLTAMIRLNRPAHRATARLGPILSRLGLVRVPFFANLIGGGALQLGLRAGVFGYRWLSFERR